MPLTPTKIKEFRQPTSFEYSGETVNLEYRPTAIRNTSEAELKNWRDIYNRADAGTLTPEEEAKTMQDFGAWFCKILATWDFYESVNEDGTPGPMMAITPENVVALVDTCGDFILQAVNAIYKDFSEKNSTGTAS